MKRVLIILTYSAVIGCSDPNDFETEAVPACEMLLKDNLVSSSSNDSEIEAVTACEMLLKDDLVSSSSFEDRGIWSFTQNGRVGTVRRDYSAQNSFGVTIDSSYVCKFNADFQRVIALETIGPMGRQVIIEDRERAREAARLESIQEGAERALANSDRPQPTGSGDRRWITNLEMTGCPEASDWFAMQDVVQAGRWGVAPPDRCIKIQPGTVILTPPEGSREQQSHNGHAYEKGTLENGTEFWTDELDSLSLSPL